MRRIQGAAMAGTFGSRIGGRSWRGWRGAACAVGVILGAACGSAAAQDTSWAKDVRDDGWGDGRVTADGDMIIFRRPAPKGPEGYPRLQLRYEYRDGVKVGAKVYLSLLALDEYDCKGGRFRSLRMAAFTRHNAEGEQRQEPAAAEPWSKPAPGTVDAKSLAAACER
jgi:hypothetical protein